ncbi:MAG: 5'-nucleotidase C-terminal domain-containing protein [Defluviitaleaceae bacterium]|nr:5'-nucleotidase C-terminal domain-containing protein [Defluviitaleaceae bacterium]
MAAFELRRGEAPGAAEAVECGCALPKKLKEECIIAFKVYDSCRNQHCLTHEDIGPARAAECARIGDKQYQEGDIIDPPDNAGGNKTLKNIKGGSKMFKRFTAIVVAVVIAMTLLPVSVFAEEGAKLTVIHINDRHGRMDADPFIAQMAQELRAEGRNVLILDVGDTLHGQMVTNLTRGEAMVDIMNAVGYSAMVPGNHDFNFGQDRLIELSALMDFPLLAANVKRGGEPVFDAYHVFELDGLTVGVFGLVSPETVTATDPRGIAGLAFEDPAATAREVVPLLKAAGCDFIIALTHLGLDESSAPANRSTALAGIEGIDLIVDGHSHSLLESVLAAGEAVIVQAGSFTGHIGVFEWGADGSPTARVVKVPSEDEESELKANETILALIAEKEETIEPIRSVVVGYTPFVLQGERNDVRTGETNLANLIADSMRHATGADVAFTNGGGIRASIPAGDITMGHALTTLPFSNLISKVNLSGADLLLAFEHGVSAYPEPAGLKIQVSGVKFEFDPVAEPGSRVYNVVMADGSALDVNAVYSVATMDFIIAGGDGYAMMENGTDKTYSGGDVETFIAYLATSPVISDEAEGRIRVAEREIVPMPMPTVSPVEEPEPAPVSPRSEPPGEYIVQPGDNLTKIANAHGTAWRAIWELNRAAISDPNLIFPGQKIILPAPRPAT